MGLNDLGEFNASSVTRSSPANYRESEKKELASWQKIARWDEIRGRFEAYDYDKREKVENTYPYGTYYLLATPESWKQGQQNAEDPYSFGVWCLNTRADYQTFGSLLVSHSERSCYEMRQGKKCSDPYHLPPNITKVPLQDEYSDELLAYFRTAEFERPGPGPNGDVKLTRFIPFIYVPYQCADDCAGRDLEDATRSHKAGNKYFQHTSKWEPELRFLCVPNTVNKLLATQYQAKLDEDPERWEDLTGKPLWIYKMKSDPHDKKSNWQYFMSMLPTEPMDVSKHISGEPANQAKDYMKDLRREVVSWMQTNNCENMRLSGSVNDLPAEEKKIAETLSAEATYESTETVDMMKMSDLELVAKATELGISFDEENYQIASLRRMIRSKLASS